MKPTLNHLGNFQVFHSTKEDGDMSRTSTSSYQMEKNISNFLTKCELTKENLYFVPLKGTPDIEAIDFEKTPKETIKRYYKPLLVENTDIKPHHFDGCVTFSKNKALGMTTGDCTPLVLWEPQTNMKGIIHVGSIGAVSKIISNLRHIYHDFKIEPNKVNYYVGPTIGGKDYDVTHSSIWQRLFEEKPDQKENFKKYLTEENDKLLFDLKQLINDQLLEMKADPAKIQFSEYSTSQNDSPFYSHYLSHRQNQPNGRFLTVISSN